MTVAVCIKCGAFKWGAFNPCEKCGAKPNGPDEMALSMAVSDHHFDKPSLERIGAEIRAGRPVPVDPAFVESLKDVVASPIGQRMMGMFQAAMGGAAESPPSRPPLLNNTDRIAKKLVSIEASRPGTVRMRANPFMCSAVVEALKRLGLRKPFFTSAQQFVYDSVLTHEVAMARVLPSSLLAGPTNNEHLIQCWAGSGPYVGEQGLFQMADFTSGGKDRVVLIINIEPFFAEIADLLGEARRTA
jgi:hypothetical protein